MLLIPGVVLAIDTSLPTIKNPFDSLQVKIPGMARFTEPTFTKDGTTINMNVNWIAEYIMGVYRYGISIIGILAVLAMAIGGVMWILSFGNPSIVGQAKSWITGAILGVVLALGSYILLNTINADLVRMRPIQIAYVKDVDSFDISQEDYDSTPPENAGSSHGVPLYMQASAEGKSILYGNCGPRGTIARTGCGVVSTQMVLAFYGKVISLPEITKAAVTNGARVCGSGSAKSGLIKTAQSYGFEAKEITASEIPGYLDKNQPIVVLLHGPCIYTGGGHYVVVTGWRDKAKGQVDVNDPANSRKNDSRTWTDLTNWSGCSFAGALAYTP